MEIFNIHNLFILQIKDLYSAETQLTKALARIAKRTTDEDLRDKFFKHLEQTSEHIKRLDEIAANLEFNAKGHVCKAMKGLIEEVNEIVEIRGEPLVRDAGLISVAQRIEYYEIAAYQFGIKLAQIMGHEYEVELLQKTLLEEEQTSNLLSEVSVSIILRAYEVSQKSEDQD